METFRIFSDCLTVTLCCTDRRARTRLRRVSAAAAPRAPALRPCGMTAPPHRQILTLSCPLAQLVGMREVFEDELESELRDGLRKLLASEARPMLSGDVALAALG